MSISHLQIQSVSVQLPPSVPFTLPQGCRMNNFQLSVANQCRSGMLHSNLWLVKHPLVVCVTLITPIPCVGLRVTVGFSACSHNGDCRHWSHPSWGRARSGCPLRSFQFELDVPHLIRPGVTYWTLHKSQDALGYGSGSSAAAVAHKSDTGRNPGGNLVAIV